jgi:hypothetical protein
MSDASSGEVITFPGSGGRRPSPMPTTPEGSTAQIERWHPRGGRSRILTPEQRQHRREVSRRPRRSKNGTPEERALKAEAEIKKPVQVEKPAEIKKPDEAPLVFKDDDTRDFMLRLYDLLIGPEAARLKFAEELYRRWPNSAETKKPTLTGVPDEIA